MASGHPWIFASDVADRGGAAAGDVVRVLDHKARAIGVAHYSSTSQICLRLLSDKNVPIDRAFYRSRIEGALSHRRRVISDSDAFRVVFSEADLLPGLIIDAYGEYAVMQTLNQGMDRAKDDIAEVVRELLQPRALVLRNDVPVRQREELPIEKRVLAGELPDRVPVTLNGYRFEADLLNGQKTGVYLDQRENCVAAARFARGHMLDCFTSSGGFAIHAAARCGHVTAVDSSGPALAVAARNASLNEVSNIDWREADVFEFLKAEQHRRQSYDAIVLDPPAFAKSRGDIAAAARGYKEINLRAMKLLGPGGILVTCSCSHHVSEAALLEQVAEAALDSGRTVRVLERRTQASDHPILLTVPETLYLKCLILEIVAVR